MQEADKENQDPSGFSAAFQILESACSQTISCGSSPHLSLSSENTESDLVSTQSVFSSTSISGQLSGALSSLGESDSLLESISSTQSFFPRPAPPKCRSFIFTCPAANLVKHGFTSDYFAALFDKGGLTYICCGYEYSKTGYSHVQGFVRFQSPRSFKAALKFLTGPLDPVHIEVARSPTSALAYCQKGGSYEEKGNTPHFSKSNTRSAGPRDLSAISKATEIKRQLYTSMCNGASPYSLIHERPEEYGFILSVSRFATADRIRAFPAQVLYVWGTTGLGKTTTFQTVCDRLNIKFYTKSPGDRWFDGYDQQSVILFDEFSDSSFSCHQWNGLCNPHPPTLEVKGTKLSNLATHYVVLSNRSPDDLYARTQIEARSVWDAFRRRLTSVHHVEMTLASSLDTIRQDLGLIYSTFLSDLL